MIIIYSPIPETLTYSEIIKDQYTETILDDNQVKNLAAHMVQHIPPDKMKFRCTHCEKGKLIFVLSVAATG